MIPRRKKALVLGGTIGGLLVLVFVAAVLSDSNFDRRVSGKRLSEHLLTGFAAGVTNSEKTATSRRVIIEEGTNSLPLLAVWLQGKTPPWAVRFGQKLSALGILTSRFPPEEREIVACKAIVNLQADAVSLAPILAANCTNSNARLAQLAAMTLYKQAIRWPQEFSPEVENALLSSLEKSIRFLEAPAKQSSKFLFHERVVLLKNVRHRVSVKPSELLVIGLMDSSVEAQARTFRILSRRGERYKDTEAMLIEHLKSPIPWIAQNAAASLKNYGAQASNAIPHLQRAFTHTDARVRSEASNAVGRITALIKD